MALDDTDRRRFITAAIVTMLALPALWWANRDEGAAAPTLATAGVEVGSNSNTASATTFDDTIPNTSPARSNLPPTEPIDNAAPIFFDGPVGNIGGVSEIAVPSRTGETVVTEATYRSTIAGTRNCFSRSLAPGRTVTVVNLDNNRRTTCRVVLAPATQGEELVLHTDRFVELADITDAPIPVEIRL